MTFFYIQLGFNRPYLNYFHIDAVDAAGGIGTITALIIGMVSSNIDFITLNHSSKLQHTIGQPLRISHLVY